MSFFSNADNVTAKKIKWNDLSDEDRKNWNVYMTNRMLSMNKNLIEIINYAQVYYNIPANIVYNVYLSLLPQENSFSKYIKKSAEKHNKDLVVIIAKYYEISKREAKQYLDALSKNEVKDILRRLGKNDQEVKKLIK